MTQESNGPAWFYRKGEAQIFEDGVCPDGWQDTPVLDDESEDPDAGQEDKPKRGRKPKAPEAGE